MLGTIYCCDFGIPNYSVVSTNGILSVTPSIAVTVIADGSQKYTGMKILRLLLWLLVAVNGDTINYTQQLLPLNSLMLGLSYCCDSGIILTTVFN
jgi:hypothetical protein